MKLFKSIQQNIDVGKFAIMCIIFLFLTIQVYNFLELTKHPNLYYCVWGLISLPLFIYLNLKICRKIIK